MKPINRALAYIETHLEHKITIELLTKVSYISPFHFARVFKGLTGFSVQQYIRYRRLTIAAKRLVVGNPTIFEVALGVGYSSHSAFTKAFVKRFQCTPTDCEAQFEALIDYFVEPIFISQNMKFRIDPPRVEQQLQLTVAGMPTKFVEGDKSRVFFEDLLKCMPQVKHKTERFCMVIWNRQEEENDQVTFELFAGVPISKVEDLPQILTTRRVEEGRCLVFAHTGNDDDFSEWIYALYGEWFPQSEYQPVSSLHLQYVTEVEDKTNHFHREVWIPIKAQAN